MKITIKAILSLSFAAVFIGGCAPKSASVQYAGSDVCEYAKQKFIQASEEYEQAKNPSVIVGFFTMGMSMLPAHMAEVNVQSARANMVAACRDSQKPESGVWACAEGHSCK